jgi:hypothetical protein
MAAGYRPSIGGHPGCDGQPLEDGVDRRGVEIHHDLDRFEACRRSAAAARPCAPSLRSSLSVHIASWSAALGIMFFLSIGFLLNGSTDGAGRPLGANTASRSS